MEGGWRGEGGVGKGRGGGREWERGGEVVGGWRREGGEKRDEEEEAEWRREGGGGRGS